MYKSAVVSKERKRDELKFGQQGGEKGFRGLNFFSVETVCLRDICTLLFIPALFTRAKTWKQPVFNKR